MSNNGSQHLAALCKDETTAPLVNLTESALPGDLYSHVADHVWLKIAQDTEALEVEHEVLEDIIEGVIALKARIAETEPKTAERAELIAEMAIFRDINRDLIKRAAPLYWNRITDSKERRKIVKRGTMTLALI